MFIEKDEFRIAMRRYFRGINITDYFVRRYDKEGAKINTGHIYTHQLERYLNARIKEGGRYIIKDDTNCIYKILCSDGYVLDISKKHFKNRES